MLINFLVLYVARTLRKGTINVGNKHTSTVQLYGGVPLNLPAVTCRTFLWRTCEKVYKCTSTLDLHGHNFDGRTAHCFRCTSLQASFLYMYYSGIIQYNYNYCCGRVCPRCCRLISVNTYATGYMHALSTLELKGGIEHAKAI